jgi:hypothetical protein
MKGMPEQRQITITESGRSGSISYREGTLELHFDWEFGGTCLAVITGESLRRLRDTGGLSAEQAREILEFVAQQAVAQKAPGHPFDIDERACEIELR